MTHTTLSAIATGRPHSLFSEDLDDHHDAITERVRGCRVLAIGAAGSIGSNTIRTLSRYQPLAIHVIDQNENALAELVRLMRSQSEPFNVEDFQLLPLDYGSALTRSFVALNGPYDIVLNFAAIKHVRSEKDPFSILQMIDTNLIKQARFLNLLKETTPDARYFSVSTDKAANPSSFMGATKRAMEHALFSEATASGFSGPITSARFANVAFSNGSLLQSFEQRLALRQPLACPRDIKRYFVSLEESGQICCLAALFLNNAEIGIPDLDPETQLVPLQAVAEKFLEVNGFEAEHYENEDEARLNVERDASSKRWPLLLTPGDTAGEKPYEEFVAVGETAKATRLKAIQSVSYIPLADPTVLTNVLQELESLIQSPDLDVSQLDKDALKAQIARLEPEFMNTHVASSLSLDNRI